MLGPFFLCVKWTNRMVWLREGCGGRPSAPKRLAGAPRRRADTEPREQPDGGAGLVKTSVGLNIPPPARPKKQTEFTGSKVSFFVEFD